jgi:catechol 2,3-dioxygenase-like lactoylglutathione lyase family enzyme
LIVAFCGRPDRWNFDNAAWQAQEDRIPGLRLNHVGVFAKKFDESYNFYTKTLGFREAFSLKDKDGKPTVTYLQINQDTFLALAPATGDRTPESAMWEFGPTI